MGILLRKNKKTSIKKLIYLIIFSFFITITGFSAGLDLVKKGNFLIINQEIIKPSDLSPLTATIKLDLLTEASVELRVSGRNGAGSDIVHSFNQLLKNHTIDVLGMYGGFDNRVTLTFYDKNQDVIGSRVYTITTKENIIELPKITIDVLDSSKKRDSIFTLVSYRGHAKNLLPTRPFIFDLFGDIRWYLDYSSHKRLNRLNFVVGVERLQNGNLYFGNSTTSEIYEVDLHGKIINSWGMPGYKFHHNVIEKPAGNFLVTVTNKSIDTVEDYIIEIARRTGEIVTVWDLRKSLDVSRIGIRRTDKDWFHGNSILYSSTDNTIIVSGREQGVIKLTKENEVVWILSPYRGWGTVYNKGEEWGIVGGVDLSQFLLHPLDSGGKKISDLEILEGTKNHLDFEWNWGQHAPKFMPNGNIILFDNGDKRNFRLSSNKYSRAVEYKIDEADKTVKQVWSYGKKRGQDTYSRTVSDVDYLPASDSVIFSSGNIRKDGIYTSKVIEVDYSTKRVLFEVSITPPKDRFIVFQRTERVEFYQ